MNRYTLLSAAAAIWLLASCASTDVNALKEIPASRSGGDTGYVAIHFTNHTEAECHARLVDSASGSEITIPLDRPAQVSSWFVLGKKVHETRGADSAKMDFTLVPLRSGTYSIDRIESRAHARFLLIAASNGMNEISVQCPGAHFTVRSGEITYLGAMSAYLHIPWFGSPDLLVHVSDNYDHDLKPYEDRFKITRQVLGKPDSARPQHK